MLLAWPGLDASRLAERVRRRERTERRLETVWFGYVLITLIGDASSKGLR